MKYATLKYLLIGLLAEEYLKQLQLRRYFRTQSILDKFEIQDEPEPLAQPIKLDRILAASTPYEKDLTRWRMVHSKASVPKPVRNALRKLYKNRGSRGDQGFP
jgi:hypothetical protein